MDIEISPLGKLRVNSNFYQFVAPILTNILHYKCDSCGKTFSIAGDLKKHINAIHNRQRDHKCDSCGKEFTQVASLKTHINSVHNRQKDHKCDFCEKAFSEAGTLRKHINSIHNS